MVVSFRLEVPGDVVVQVLCTRQLVTPQSGALESTALHGRSRIVDGLGQYEYQREGTGNFVRNQLFIDNAT